MQQHHVRAGHADTLEGAPGYFDASDTAPVDELEQVTCPLHTERTRRHQLVPHSRRSSLLLLEILAWLFSIGGGLRLTHGLVKHNENG
jgi:hypothetical protein